MRALEATGSGESQVSAEIKEEVEHVSIFPEGVVEGLEAGRKNGTESGARMCITCRNVLKNQLSEGG